MAETSEVGSFGQLAAEEVKEETGLDFSGMSKFIINMSGIQVNHPGHYYLHVVLENMDSADDVHIEIGWQGHKVKSHEAYTELFECSSSRPPVYTSLPATTACLTFFFPNGFPRNKEQMHLLVELYEVILSPGAQRRGRNATKKSGEVAQTTKFIADTVVHLFPNTVADNAKDELQPVQAFSKVVVLSRRLRCASICMQCGRLKFAAELHHLQQSTVEETPVTNEADKVIASPTPADSSGVPIESSPPLASPTISELAAAPKVEEPASPVPLESDQIEFRQPSPLAAQLPTPSPQIPGTPGGSDEVTEPAKLTKEVTSQDVQAVSPAASPAQYKALKPSSLHLSSQAESHDLVEPIFLQPQRPPRQAPRVHQLLAESPKPHTVKSGEHAWLPSLVTAVNKEEVTVILHAASGVPLTPDGDIPTPYCIICVLAERVEVGVPQTLLGVEVSHASMQPTRYPTWEEVISITTPRTNILDQVLVFEIGDSCFQELLVSFKFPLCYLQPYHQYHLELVQTVESQVTCLFVSVMRKLPTLSTDPSAFTFAGLEVLLHRMEQPLVSGDTLIALAKVVSDLYVYRDLLLRDVKRTAGFAMMTINFPNPHPASFSIAGGPHQGYPQISLPSASGVIPVWKHSFLFTEPRDKAIFFTPGSAIVLELYQSSKVRQGQQWRLQDPVAYASILLDRNIQEQLAHDNGHLGMRLTKVPLQRCNIRTADGTAPSLEVILRLLLSEKPDSLASVSNIEHLPHLDLTPVISDPCLVRKPSEVLTFNQRFRPLQNSMAAPESAYQSKGFWQLVVQSRPSYKPLKDGELPPHDALENILPEYKYIFVDPEPKTLPPGESMANQTRHPVLEVPKVEKEDLERTTMTLLDYQMRELDKYRTAVKTMGNDIVALRHEIQTLEAENSKLRLELEHYNDTTALLREDNLDLVTKPELAAKYVVLKRKLNNVTVELGDYRDRVCELQNSLISKNDREKELLQISDAHQSQQETMLRLQQKVDKCKRLEEACRKQEKVIEKMEKLIGNTSAKGSAANDALVAENHRLRSELDELKDEHQAVDNNLEQHEEEKLKLYTRLEKTESRVRSLESQLADNARQWARDKSDLMARLKEAEHGLSKPVYKDYPKIQPRNRFEPPVEPRKYSRAPPGGTRQIKGHRFSPKLEPLYLR